MIKIEFTEVASISCPIEIALDLMDFNFIDWLNKSEAIESIKEYEREKYRIITKSKSYFFKNFKLNANLLQRKNKKLGIMQIYSDEKIKIGQHGCNLLVDCRIVVEKESNEKTKVSVKFIGSVDFGLGDKLSNTIKGMILEKLKKQIQESLKKYG